MRASLYPINYDSECYRELEAMPNMRLNSHDGHNVPIPAIPTVDEPHVDIETTFVDAEGNMLTGDAMAWALAQYLANPARLPLFGPAAVFSQMFRHQAYRLYCGKYDDDTVFRSDVDYVTAMIPDSMSDAKAQWIAATENMTYDQSQDVMLSLIRSFGV